MGLRVATNVTSLASQRHLGNGTVKQRQALERLSSGTRIVKAGDDAAGLAISEKLKAEIRSNSQAERNANDGISMIQTAEGGLNELSSILIRLRELSIQAASDTVGESERTFSDIEFQNLVEEVDRIALSTEFNGKNLLSGDAFDFSIQVGVRNNEAVDRITFNTEETHSTVDKLELNGLNVLDKGTAQTNLETLDKAINAVSGKRANLGAVQNRLASTIQNIQVKNENLSEANSRIRDSDVAKQTSELTKANIITSAGVSVLGQANSAPSAALKLIG